MAPKVFTLKKWMKCLEWQNFLNKQAIFEWQSNSWVINESLLGNWKSIATVI